MYIIIAGAGVVGFNIASLLAEAKHDVAVVDQSDEAVEAVRRQLDVRTISGNAATPRVLREAEVSRANLVVAVTNNDETNVLVCFLAKELGAAMTVARVRNPDYSGYFVTAARSPMAARKVMRPKSLGVDLFINPEVEVAEEIMGILSGLYPTDVQNFAGGRVQIREFRVGQEPPAGQAVSAIRLPEPATIVAISRGGQTSIPTPDEVVQPGDHIYLVAAAHHMEALGRMFAVPPRPVKNVAIFGGERAGFLVADGLEKRGINVKLIDPDLGRCQALAARLERTSVLHGDATDADFLTEQGITAADAFVATTSNDEINILCGLLARQLGVRRTIITVVKPGYIALAQAVGVDVAVSSLLEVAGRITRFVLHGGVISATFIGGKDLQAVEFVIGQSAAIAQHSLAESGLPKETIVAAVVRDDDVMVPAGDGPVRPGDHVIIVSRLSAIPAVERLFK